MDEIIFKRCLDEWQKMPGDSKYATLYLKNAGQSPLDTKFNTLCQLYMDSDDKQRSQLHYIFDSEKNTSYNETLCWDLIMYVRRISKLIKSEKDICYLYYGLYAVAMVGYGPDYRDVIVSLAFLYYAAKQAGINVTQAFKDIAVTTIPKINKFIMDFLKRDVSDIEEMVAQFSSA